MKSAMTCDLIVLLFLKSTTYFDSFITYLMIQPNESLLPKMLLMGWFVRTRIVCARNCCFIFFSIFLSLLFLGLRLRRLTCVRQRCIELVVGLVLDLIALVVIQGKL
jgi:hypothetical protein